MEEVSEREAESVEKCHDFSPTSPPEEGGGKAVEAESKPEVVPAVTDLPGKIKVTFKDGLIFNSDFDSGCKLIEKYLVN